MARVDPMQVGPRKLPRGFLKKAESARTTVASQDRHMLSLCSEAEGKGNGSGVCLPLHYNDMRNARPGQPKKAARSLLNRSV